MEPRVDYREAVRVLWPGEVSGVVARAVNLSSAGILVDAPTPTPCPVGSDVLCDVIPAWVKTYVKDAPPSEGDDILRAQNNRDFERSYACAQAAARQAGSYTCAGKAYVGAFYREVGGKSGVPSCGGGSRASNEIVF